MVNNLPANAGDMGLIPRMGRSPGEGNSYALHYSGLKNSMDYIFNGVTKSSMRLSDFHFSLSCIEEGNGNPLQCSCLENPRDGGAWWAAVYGVAQSQTRLKQLSNLAAEPINNVVIVSGGQ